MQNYFWDASGVAERTWDDVGQILKQRRERLRLTQQEVADRAELSLAIVQVIESGRKDSFRRTTLAAIADALEWEPDAVDQLLAGTDPADLPTVEHAEEVDPVMAAIRELKDQVAELSDLIRRAGIAEDD